MDRSGGSFNSRAALHDSIYLTMMEIAIHLYVKSPAEAFSQPLLLARLQGQRISDTIVIMLITEYLNKHHNFHANFLKCYCNMYPFSYYMLILIIISFLFVLLSHHANQDRSMIRHSRRPFCPLTLSRVVQTSRECSNK